MALTFTTSNPPPPPPPPLKLNLKRARRRRVMGSILILLALDLLCSTLVGAFHFSSQESSHSKFPTSRSLERASQIVKRAAGRHHQPFASLQPSSSTSAAAAAAVSTDGSLDDTADDSSSPAYASGDDSRDYSASDNSTAGGDYDADAAGDEDSPTTGVFVPVVVSENPSRPSRELTVSSTPASVRSTTSGAATINRLGSSSTVATATSSPLQMARHAGSSTTTTTTSGKPLLPLSPSTVRLQKVQVEDRRAPTPVMLEQPTFNVNMGADRLLIKQQPPTAPSTIRYDREEVATESVKHELLAGSQLNERRQDLLYPSGSINSEQDSANQLQSSLETSKFSEARQQDSISHQSICYTPIALLMVILITMLITILVCFCTHMLIKHLSRHQFDLIENSKQFNVKHGSGFSSQQQGAPATVSTSCGTANSRIHCNSPGSSGSSNDKARRKSFMQDVFQGSVGELTSGGQRRQQAGRDAENGCAFKNPYFNDDLAHRQQQQQHLDQLRHHQLTTSAGKPANGEQLDFIENHIAKLHSRQVTSSVKELSIFGIPVQQLPIDDSMTISPLSGELNASRVVDLTSEEQRARILADPLQGDLIAVDITGSDFIGLGFEVCGDAAEGIFVRSVLSRGPARETGCIQPGDRIKCLNISLEGMTLQDAYDILNCASPYKMRLLLEKQAVPMSSKHFDRLRSTLVLRQASSKKFFATQNPQLELPAKHSKSAATGYFKRLANMVSSANTNKPLQNYNNALSVARRMEAAGAGVTGNEMFLEESSRMYLGSAVAREHLTQPMNEPVFAHANLAYQRGGEEEEEEEEDNQEDSLDEARGRNLQSETADSSLDYENKNANHKLHGPKRENRDSSSDPQKLFGQMRRFSVSDEPLKGAKVSLEVTTGSPNSSGNNARRQSDDAFLNASTRQQADFRKALADQHLIQTQSQPVLRGTPERDEG